MNWRSLAAPAALILASCGAHAADDLSTGLSKCAGIADNLSRLACFDQLAAQAKSQQGAPAPAAAAAPSQPAPQHTASSAKEEESWFGIGNWFGGGTPPVRQTTPQQFGSESIPAGTPEAAAAPTVQALDSITAGVSDVAFNAFGRFTVFLDNGQIWQQLQGDADIAHFDKGKKATVTIARGFLGSYNLTIADKNGMYKVKRLK